jgi:hypothetical protein
VTRQVPAMARSPIAVTATFDRDRPSQRGGDLVVLVAFAAFDLTDYGFSPPTWVVTQPMLSSEWRVEPWRAGPLPAHFTTLLNVAGIPT